MIVTVVRIHQFVMVVTRIRNLKLNSKKMVNYDVQRDTRTVSKDPTRLKGPKESKISSFDI